jgi:hypothetical protein
MGKTCSTTPFCSIVMVAGLLIVFTPCVPDSAYSADSTQEQPKTGPSQAEKSPEEAAGGAHNLQLLRKACDEDVKKLCPDIRPGGGRIMQCLHGQESNLSPACRQALGPRSSHP